MQPVLPVPHDYWSNLRAHQSNFEWRVAEPRKLKSRKQREKFIDSLFVHLYSNCDVNSRKNPPTTHF